MMSELRDLSGRTNKSTVTVMVVNQENTFNLELAGKLQKHIENVKSYADRVIKFDSEIKFIKSVDINRIFATCSNKFCRADQ